MKETRVFLIRHGQTDWNLTQRIQGHLDVPLNAEGIAQAAGAARYLESEPLTAVYSSDLHRAAQTAKAIAALHGLSIHLDSDLREARFGEWQGLDAAQIRARDPETYRLWRKNSFRHRPPGGETIQELTARVGAAYARVLAAHPGETVAIVSHGGPLKALVLYALNAPLEVYPQLQMRNAAVSLIEVGARGPVLARYNLICFQAKAAPAAFEG